MTEDPIDYSDPMDVGPAIHRIDYTNRKIVVVIDKDHFCLCKRLLIENASDAEFASALAIPIEKVRVFKYKMAIFEDRIRGRRRAARLNCRRMKRKKKRLSSDKVGELKKMEMSSEERFKCARDLILQNYTTREISKVLKISIRSVTRFRKRLREAKKEMVESGELDVGEAEEEWEFKYLSPELKGQKISELLEQGLSAVEIGNQLKINERSVRRWRLRIEQLKKNPKKSNNNSDLPSSYKLLPKSYYPHRRYVKCVDRATVENIRKLLESGATNKEICVRLAIPMTIVMKVVQRIWTNTIEGIIDDTPEKLRESEKRKRLELDEPEISEEEIQIKKQKRKKKKVKQEIEMSEERPIDDDDDDWDPHGLYRDENDYWNDDFVKYEGIKKNEGKNEGSGVKMEPEDVQEIYDPLCSSPPAPASPKPTEGRQKLFGNSTKIGLTDNDALVAHKLKEKNVRTIDIAVMMDISERTVTRLFNKAKTLDTSAENEEVDKIVNKFIENQDQYRGVTKPRVKGKAKKSTRFKANVEKRKDTKDEENDVGSKQQTGLKLLAMNVKVKDIMKMLNVTERTVSRWKLKLKEQPQNPEENDLLFDDSIEIKEEPDDDYEEYQMS